MTRLASARSSWRDWLAAILLVVFCLQAAVRLVLIPQFYSMGRLTALVHAFTIAVVLGAGAVGAIAFRGRRALQFILALGLSAAWLACTSFDISGMLTANFWGKPLRLDAIAEVYCEGRPWTYCLTDYPAVTGSALAGILALGIVLFACVDAFAGYATRLLSFVERRVLSRLRLRSLPVIGAGCSVYALLWLSLPQPMYHREPIAWMFGTSGFESGPAELITVARPHFVVPPTPGARPLTIVLITVDALRADYIELRPGRPSLTPFLQSLAAAGKLSDLGPANAVCTNSYCGIVSIQASATWASMQDGPPLMLADVLAANGYRNHFLLSGRHNTFLNMTQLYGPSLTTLLDDGSADAGKSADDRQIIVRLAALNLPASGKNYISIHMMSAHPFGLRFDLANPDIVRPMISSTRTNDYPRYYADGVRQTDWVIEQLFRELERKHLLDNALVAITGDHGERLGVKGISTHFGPPDPAAVRIPLLLYHSSPSAFPPHSAVSQTDIAPTLLDLAGISIPENWQGQSLLRPSLRNVAATDDIDFTGLVAQFGGKVALVRCALDDGRTELLPIAGNELSASEIRQALVEAPGLYARLRRRNDAGKCFRPSP